METNGSADEGIPLTERLHMQRIRELDMEQLEVEEVDTEHSRSSDSDDGSLEARGNGRARHHSGFMFDTSLTGTHPYPGEMNDINCRRSFMEGGAVLTLPIFYLEGIVLFPDATLPLRVIQPRFKAAVELAVHHEEAPYTIGVVHVRARPQGDGLYFASVGTTAEIRQLSDLADGSVNIVTRGRQRFRICNTWTDANGVPCAQVQIILEDMPLHIPRDAFGVLASTPNFLSGKVPRRAPKSDDCDTHSESEEDLSDNGSSSLSRRSAQGESYINDVNLDEDDSSGWWWWARRRGRGSLQRQMAQELGYQRSSEMSQDASSANECSLSSPSSAMHSRSDYVEGKARWGGACKAWALDGFKLLYRVQRSAWPHWVYRMYDAYDLARRAADMWRQLVELPSLYDMVKHPEVLSYHIASKIPVQDATRQELLEIDGVVARLQKEIQLLELLDRIRCKSCKVTVANRSDMLVMSSDGPVGTFVNDSGYVHETLTLRKVCGVSLQGNPETQHSWFPGYSWTIAVCSVCEHHMGWLFRAVDKKLRPRQFWGLRRSQLVEKAC